MEQIKIEIPFHSLNMDLVSSSLERTWQLVSTCKGQIEFCYLVLDLVYMSEGEEKEVYKSIFNFLYQKITGKSYQSKITT